MTKRIRHANVDQPVSLQCELLEPRVMLSTVQLFAAGSEGTEIINLQIDGATVATFDTLGDGASTGDYATFEYSTAETITAGQIRVEFVNDIYQPEIGLDRNVRLDAISIDGQRYETEDPSVFSTGTWRPDDGVVPGFREWEYLHANGYFQFADDDVPSEPGSVVINEIHYNPGPDGVVDPDAEFIELHNPGTEAVDLSGMSFVGFDLVIPNGVSLAGGQYAIVSPSISIAQSTWGVTPIAEFAAGGISGGGETIQLIAADGVTIVDEVSYDDASPWPGGPDGNGPSLELVNPTFDNAVASSWLTSAGDPTPGAQNSVFAEEPVSGIEDITITPGQPVPNQAFTISATIADATFANLTYKIMFGNDVTVAMTNAGGDIWQATVPGQDAGTLVRYRIESDVAVAPFADDTINYLGVVVSPTDITGNSLPVFHWFIDPADYDTLYNDVFLTNEKFEAVVAYGDQVIDNATVRVRGSFSRTFNKKGFKFEMPKGYLLDFGSLAQSPVDEFGIVTDWADWTVASAQVAWEVWNAESESFTSTFHTRVEQNGEFYGVYRYQGLYDGVWRNDNGFADDQFFKAEEGGWNSASTGFDKKTPKDEDYTPVFDARDVLLASPSQSKTDWIYANVDIPDVINYMALSALMRHGDQAYHNYYAVQDAETGRWSQVEWDLDLAWRDSYSGIPGFGDDFTTLESVETALLDSVWEVGEFQDLYWRRLQTLVDTYLSDDGLVERREEIIESIGATNSALDFAAWGHSDIYNSSFFDDRFQEAIDTRQAIFAAESRLPGSAISNPNIIINELHYNPAGDDAEFLELYNASSESVDLSGWEIDGVGLVINFGTVILPGEYAVFTDADTQFRSQINGNVLVSGQYSGGLKGSGETVTLLDADGNTVDVVSYLDVDPWTSVPDGSGFTLALIDPSLNNNAAANWVASNEINGTPGASNDVSQVETTQISIFAAGTTSDEIIELEIAGVVVGTYELSAFGAQPGDSSARIFTELTYSSTIPFDANDVRIHFVNDFYDPANGIDRNVKIDRIEIDSVVFETEASNVFSTGTWKPEDGIVPGFRESERLHADGYFQFAE